MIREEAKEIIELSVEVKTIPRIAKLYEALAVAIEALSQPPRPKGQWIFEDIDYFRCSECGSYEVDKTNFCPNCGADMRKNEQ